MTIFDSKARFQSLYDGYLTSLNTLNYFVRETLGVTREKEQTQAKLIATMGQAIDGTLPVISPAERPVKISIETANAVFTIMKSDAAIRSRFQSLALEMAFVYLYSVFDAFLQDVVRETLLVCPDALRSQKQMSYEKIVELEQAGTLIKSMADKEVGEFGYLSVEDQQEYLRRKFGTQVIPENSLDALIRASAIRNLLVHNNGIVNGVFQRKVSGSGLQLGERVMIEEQYWGSTLAMLGDAGKEIFAAIDRKFFQTKHETGG